METLDVGALPAWWDRLPAPVASAAFGDAWGRARRTLALHVPSAAVHEETNVLLNPAHAAATRVRVSAERDFSFDPRLID